MGPILLASIRPRSFEHGNSSSLGLYHRERPSLQFVHVRLNMATDIIVRQTSESCMLQFVHVRLNMATGRKGERARDGRHASIRPRSFEHGNSLLTLLSDRSGVPLQFVHVRLNMATSPQTAAYLRLEELQFVHVRLNMATNYSPAG